MNENIPDIEGVGLVTLFIVGNTLVFALGGRAGADIWLAFLVAIVLAAPMLAIYSRLRSLMHGESLASGFSLLIGKWPSRIISFFYSFYAWRLGCFVLGDVTTFIEAVALPTTPQIVLALGFGLLMLWAVKDGVETMARFSVVMGKLVFTVLIVAVLLLLTEVDLQEFLPIMYNGAGPVFEGAFQLLDFPFLEPVLFIWVFEGLANKNSPYKVIFSGFFVGALILLLVTSVSLAVLGAHRYPIYYFPIYTAVARIDIATFLTRLEAIVGITFAVGSFVKMTVCLLATSKALAHGFGFKDYRFLVTPLVLSVIPGSQWLTSTMMNIERSATKTLSASALTFQISLPIILWITAEIKVRRASKKVS